MKKEKPAYKLTLKELIPFYNGKTYGERNSAAYYREGDERSRYCSRQFIPRLVFISLYDGAVLAGIANGVMKGIETLVK